MDEIDRKAELSRDDKYRQRGKTAAQAIADFEESRTLVRAREAAELMVAGHDVEQLVAEVSKALNQVEQGWRRAIGKIAERASMIKISPAAHPDFRRKRPCYAKRW